MGGVGGIGGLGGVSSVFGNGYGDKVLGVARANLIGYFAHDERGGAVSHDYSAYQNDGAYTNGELGQLGIGDGRTSMLFDNDDSYNNIYDIYKIFDATTNLITNPSFETNTTGWAASGSNTIEQSTDQAKFGTNSLKCLWVDNTVLAAYMLTLSAVSHSLGVWIYIPMGSWSATNLAIRFADYTSATGTLFAVADLGIRDAWQHVSVEDVTPDAGDLVGDVRIYYTTGSPTAGDHVFVGGVQTEARATVTDHCDGSLGERYSWQGTAHASTSTRESGGDEGGMMVWFSADDWDAGGIDYALNLGVDATANFININKAADGTIVFYYEAGNTIDSVTSGAQTDDGVFKCCLLTWSSAADELQGFLAKKAITGLGRLFIVKG